MEEKRRAPRRSLSARMALALGFLVFLIILISNVTTYRYFSKILTEENVRKDGQLLRQNAGQLELLLQDAVTITQNLILDQNVQSFCAAGEHDYYAVEDMADRLTRFIAVRHGLHSVTLLTGEEMVWSLFPFDRSYRRALEESGLLEGEYGFTRPLELRYGGQELRLMAYRSAVYDLHDPQKKIGELMIDLDLGYLEDLVGSWNREDEEYTLLLDGEVLIPSPSGGNEAALAGAGTLRDGSREAADGYLLSERVPNTPLTLVSFRSRDVLRGRADYLIVFFLIFTSLTLLLLLVAIERMVRRLTEPVRVLSAGMLRFAGGDMETQVSVHTGDELELLSGNFNDMVRSIRRLINQVVEDEKMKKKIKFDLMISKIHPHFIYNTLNSVIYLARKEGCQDVVEVVRALILILHDGMSIHKEVLYDTLEVELSVIEAYATIQNYRYKGKFSLEVSAGTEVQPLCVAKNVLQPLVENAIFHGVAPKEGRGMVSVRAVRAGEWLTLEVEDDGVGMPPETVAAIRAGAAGLQRTGDGGSVHAIALVNVFERLEFLYGSRYTLAVDSAPGAGTRFAIRVPALTEEEIAHEKKG